MILCLPGKPVLKRFTARQTTLQQRYIALLALIEQRKPALISVLDSAAAAPIRLKTFKPVYREVPARNTDYALALFFGKNNAKTNITPKNRQDPVISAYLSFRGIRTYMPRLMPFWVLYADGA